MKNDTIAYIYVLAVIVKNDTTQNWQTKNDDIYFNFKRHKCKWT